MNSISLGPFAIPAGPLLLLAAALASVAVAKWAGRARRVDVEPLLWISLAASLLAARAAFVAQHFAQYRLAPASMFDIRDGGFMTVAGILAAVVMVAWFAWRSRERRKPLLLAAAAGASAWALGMAGMMLLSTGPSQLPGLALTRLDGGPVSLASLAGKPMVVNLWATWCPPCRREMPILRDAQAQRKDVIFVFANQGEPAAAVHSYLDAQGLVLDNVLLDPDMRLGHEAGSRALPTTLFFDASGALVERHIGGLSAATLAQQLESLVPGR